jgi:hypothetical protein
MSDDAYDGLRERLAGALERAAHAQTAGPRPPIDVGYDDLDAAIPRLQDPRYVKLLIALEFWDGWIDSSNHDWRFYEPISERDWPGLALDVAGDLRSDREIQNALVLQQFDGRLRKTSPSVWKRVKSALGVG